MQGHFYHFKYPYADGDGYIEIATTRPETMLGDTAIVVNPNDDRYKDVIGKKVILPIVGRELPILADEYVDIDFGSGAMKVTPAHDPNDFEIGQRHSLENIIVMDENGKMNDKADKYAGLDRFECRKQLVEDLKAQDLVIKIEEHVHSVGHSERSGAVVEPYLSTQWFVKMKPLAQRSLDNQKQMIASIFIHHVLRTLSIVGWKKLETGQFLDNYGGVIKYLLGTIKKLVKFMLVKKRLKILIIGCKMKMF